MQGRSVEEELQWLEIRDHFVGSAYAWPNVNKDVKRALELAPSYQHPEARWLMEAFAGRAVNSNADAIAVLEEKNDARSLCFTAIRSRRFDVVRLRQSAELGYAFAQSSMAQETSGQEQFTFASQAASQGERDGFFWLGRCFASGEGCERDREKAKKNFLIAANLNHAGAMSWYGVLLRSDPKKWHWWGLAARRGDYMFYRKFAEEVDRFSSDPTRAPHVFAIGRALKGHVNTEDRTIFGHSWSFNSLIGPANRAISFFDFQVAAARKAVDTWCLIARRFGNGQINKDVRKLIGQWIWENRHLAEYKEPDALLDGDEQFTTLVDQAAVSLRHSLVRLNDDPNVDEDLSGRQTKRTRFEHE